MVQHVRVDEERRADSGGPAARFVTPSRSRGSSTKSAWMRWRPAYLPRAHDGQFGEIRRLEARLDSRACVTERADSALKPVAAAGPSPCGRQLVHHKPVVRRQRIEVRDLAVGRFVLGWRTTRRRPKNPITDAGWISDGLLARTIGNPRRRQRVGCLHAACAAWRGVINLEPV